MDSNVEQGARNLLLNCAEMQSGQSLLILAEDASTGFFETALVDAISDAARALDIEATVQTVPFHPDVTHPCSKLASSMKSADRTLFLSRFGDQLRFSSELSAVDPVVSYVLDTHALASPFGRAHHQAFVQLKTVVNAALNAADDIHVTCPLGTDFRGTGHISEAPGSEVSVRRFPLSVFTPVPAKAFSGTIAQAGFLTGTGSNYYSPYTIPLDDILTVTFEGNTLTHLDGSEQDVRRAQRHYDAVANRYGIDGTYMHSWHAGIHPGCVYAQPAGHFPERWGSGAFGNPRLLHFHTCGAYAPGEISLNVVDPTITLDGVAVWQDGRLYPERLPGGREILGQFPCAAAVFDTPETDVGLSASGRLSALMQ